MDEKVRELDALNAKVDELPMNELMLRIDSIEHKIAQAGSYEHGSNSLSYVTHIEEHVEELNYSQKTMSNDFRAMIETIKAKMAEMKF